MAGKVSPEVIIGGTNVGKISHLSVDQPFNGHHFFTIVCPLSERANSMVRLGGDYIGKEITISLTTGYQFIPGKLSFKGMVTNIKLSKHENSLMQLMIQGFSPTRMMDDGLHYQSWKDVALSSIVDDVCGKYPLSVGNKVDFKEPLPYVNQYNESSYSFLRRMMATYGQWCYYDGDQLVLGKPDPEETISLTFGKEMSALELSADVVPADFKLLGYNYVDDEHFEMAGAGIGATATDQLGTIAGGAAKDIFPNQPTIVEPLYSLSQAGLETQAARRKSGQEAKFVNLFGQSSHLGLKLGQVIEVKSDSRTMGIDQIEADYGSFRIVHVTHIMDATGNYTNSFQAIPANLEVPPIQEDIIRPQVAETQPAEVTDNKDPEGLGRVQVQFPWQRSSGETTPWIRVSTAGAGGSHGFYFTPEIGDQVLVGFTWNNADRPIVVGSLYNKSTKHEGAYDADNNSKIIKTRSGNQVTLSDKAGEESIVITNGTNVITLGLSGPTTISIETAGDLILKGNTVAITAETSFTLNSESTEMSSTEDTTIRASGELAMNTEKSVEINAAMDASIAAGKGLTASGVATAEVSAANTKVNGTAMIDVQSAMIKLN